MIDATQEFLLSAFVNYVLPTLGTLIASLAVWCLKRMGDRMGLHLRLTRDDALRAAVRKAIAGAEEWACRSMKFKTGDKTGGLAKSAWVKDHVKALWPDLIPDDLNKIIDEELGSMENVGATGPKALT